MTRASRCGPFRSLALWPTPNIGDTVYRVGYGKSNREAAMVVHGPGGWNCRRCGATYCPHVRYAQEHVGVE